MIRSRRLVAVAVGVLACTGGAALAQEPNGGIPPVFDATYVVVDGKAEFRITLTNFPTDRYQVYDFEFIDDSWVPPRTTPEDPFEEPDGWDWDPIPGGGGWRVFTGSAMQTGIEHRFKLPIDPNKPPTGSVQLKASDANHFPFHQFAANPPAQYGLRGTVPRQFRFAGTVPGSAFFAGVREMCGRPAQLEAQLTLSTARGQLTIRNPRGAARGPIAPNGVFRATGPGEVYAGVISGRRMAGSYVSTQAGCPAQYFARVDLEGAGRAVPLCGRPTVVAPARAVVTAGFRVRLRVGATCAGRPLSRWPVEIVVRDEGRTFKVGTIRTALVRKAIAVKLGDTRPDALLLRAKAGQGLRAGTDRVALDYGRLG